MTDVIQTPDPPAYPDDREWHNVPGPSYQEATIAYFHHLLYDRWPADRNM